LYAAHTHAVVQKDTITEVRIPAGHVDDNIRMTEVPAGGVQFNALRDCQIRIRKPAYLTNDCLASANDSAALHFSEDGRWITVDVHAGQCGEIIMPQTEWTATERFGPPNDMGYFADKPSDERTTFTLNYKGNTVCRVCPESVILPYVTGL
jgi:hypothetical protein